MIKVHIDGALFLGTKQGGNGTVIRDEHESLISSLLHAEANITTALIRGQCQCASARRLVVPGYQLSLKNKWGFLSCEEEQYRGFSLKKACRSK